MDYKRFLIAIVASVLIIFGWTYLFPTKPDPQIANTAATPTPAASPAAATPQPASSPAAAATPGATPGTTPGATPAAPSDAVAHQKLNIQTPLYNVKLDNHGATATSWIINKLVGRKDEPERPIYSVAGNKNNPVALELISQEGLKLQPERLPLGLLTGDAPTDVMARDRNYAVSGVDLTGDDTTVNLAPGFGTKRVEFKLTDPATQTEIIKAITFKEGRYDVDIEVKVTRAGQPVPKVALMIGPNIGDQGVKHYSFYSVAPEGIGVIDGGVHRYLGAAINGGKEGGLLGFFQTARASGPDIQLVPGKVDWAGVGDTYFAMMAVPGQPTEGLEYRTFKYQHDANGTKEDRFLVMAYVPVPADGSKNVLYAGPKDHYRLNDASAVIAAELKRNKLDLEQAIDYGTFSTVSRPLAEPILWCIKKLSHITGSYGIAIILFTIVIYSLFFPLKWRSSRTMKRAQKYQPRMKEIQEKMKGMKQDDPRLRELQMEQFRLMKESNMLGGCLPLLIQMLFLFALYRAITISIDFRQAPFLWIPDLSAPEPYMIHIIPLLMAGSMVVLQLITPQPSADPVQRKMMAIGMPIFMLYVLWSAPSGLLLYWLVGNIVGFSQQMIINRLIKSKDDEPPTEPDKAAIKASKKKLKVSEA
ncbi:MAG: membrane protein insertase YidC [Pyrinomonadaceae bacterium]